MYLRTIEIYCFVDDLLKANQHKEDCRRRSSDAELLTAAFVAVLFFAGNFERARRYLKESGLMPQMLSRSRFARRLHSAQSLLEQVFEQFAERHKQANWQKLYLLDSFPVAVCDNVRIKRCRLVQGAQSGAGTRSRIGATFMACARRF